MAWVRGEVQKLWLSLSRTLLDCMSILLTTELIFGNLNVLFFLDVSYSCYIIYGWESRVMFPILIVLSPLVIFRFWASFFVCLPSFFPPLVCLDPFIDSYFVRGPAAIFPPPTTSVLFSSIVELGANSWLWTKYLRFVTSPGSHFRSIIAPLRISGAASNGLTWIGSTFFLAFKFAISTSYGVIWLIWALIVASSCKSWLDGERLGDYNEASS